MTSKHSSLEKYTSHSIRKACKRVTKGEESRRQLHKTIAGNIEQDLAATLHNAPTIRPHASHHENYPT